MLDTLQFNLKLLNNKFYEYFWRSPALFVYRVESRLQRDFGWKPRLGPIMESNAVGWIREEEDFHTRIYLFNYWTDHYNVQEVPVSWQLRDAAGRIIARDELTLQPRETRVLNFQDILRAKGLATPFLGSLIFKREIKGAGYGVPMKFLHEFYGSRFACAVHEYGTVDNYHYKEVQVNVTLWPLDEIEDIDIGLTDCNFVQDDASHVLRFHLMDQQGKAVSFTGDSLGPAQTRLLSLNKLYPAWKTFLNGRPGNLRLEFPHPVGRPLIFQRYRGGMSYSLDHLTNSKATSPSVIRGDALKQAGYGPIWTSGVLLDQQMTSYVTFLMDWGFDTAFDLEGELYDASGEKCASFRHRVKPWETIALNMKDYLPAAKQVYPWVGSVTLHAVPAPGLQFVPQYIGAHIEFTGQNWRQPIGIGSAIFNTPLTDAIKKYAAGRTRNFMRVRNDETFETFLLMVNQSSLLDYTQPSETVLRLISEDGKRQSSQTVRIPPRGTFFKNIKDIFPDFQEILGGSAVAALHIRDAQVKLIGVHLLRNRLTGVYSGDHYFGG